MREAAAGFRSVSATTVAEEALDARVIGGLVAANPELAARLLETKIKTRERRQLSCVAALLAAVCVLVYYTVPTRCPVPEGPSNPVSRRPAAPPPSDFCAPVLSARPARGSSRGRCCQCPPAAGGVWPRAAVRCMTDCLVAAYGPAASLSFELEEDASDSDGQHGHSPPEFVALVRVLLPRARYVALRYSLHDFINVTVHLNR